MAGQPNNQQDGLKRRHNMDERGFNGITKFTNHSEQSGDGYEPNSHECEQHV